jgi:PAS domain S-box-containing protein
VIASHMGESTQRTPFEYTNKEDNSHRASSFHFSNDSFTMDTYVEQCRQLLERSSDAILILDADSGCFIDANQNALRLFKISREALLKVGPAEISPITQPDSRLSSEAAWEKTHQALGGDVPVFDWVYQNMAGEPITCEVTLSRFPPANRKLVLGRVIDRGRRPLHARTMRSARSDSEWEQERNTALQTQLNQTEAILQNMADAVMFLDQEHNILQINPAWEKLTGYAAPEAMNRPAFFPEHDATSPAILQSMWETALKGKTWRGVLQGRRAKGTSYETEVALTPVRNDDGEIYRFVAVQRDVTEARKLESLKTRFIADAAHDLRSPISTLKLQLYLLNKAPEQLTRHLPKMEALVGRLGTFIEDLVTLSRLELGVSTTELIRLDCNDVVRRVVGVYELLAEDKGLTLTFEGQADLPCILADSHQIERVVVNLVSNAIKYTPADGTVQITTLQDTTHVILTIRDTGIGFQPEALPYLFERFYRTDEAKQMAEGGGLGLSIVKGIVDQSGGRIEVISSPDQGSVFSVYLPIAKQE